MDGAGDESRKRGRSDGAEAGDALPRSEPDESRVEELRRKRRANLAQAMKAQGNAATTAATAMPPPPGISATADAAADAVAGTAADAATSAAARASTSGSSGTALSTDGLASGAGSAQTARDTFPDEVDGREAAYFDDERPADAPADEPHGGSADGGGLSGFATTAPSETVDRESPPARLGPIPTTAASATNGGVANGDAPASSPFSSHGGDVRPPSSVDSTLEVDERADALEAYMATVHEQNGAPPTSKGLLELVHGPAASARPGAMFSRLLSFPAWPLPPASPPTSLLQWLRHPRSRTWLSVSPVSSRRASSHADPDQLTMCAARELGHPGGRSGR